MLGELNKNPSFNMIVQLARFENEIEKSEHFKEPTTQLTHIFK